jgi:hypothetical protein
MEKSGVSHWPCGIRKQQKKSGRRLKSAAMTAFATGKSGREPSQLVGAEHNDTRETA